MRNEHMNDDREFYQEWQNEPPEIGKKVVLLTTDSHVAQRWMRERGVKRSHVIIVRDMRSLERIRGCRVVKLRNWQDIGREAIDYIEMLAASGEIELTYG